MDQRMSIGNCFDESGKLDLAKFEEYKLLRDKLIEEEEVAVKVVVSMGKRKSWKVEEGSRFSYTQGA